MVVASALAGCAVGAPHTVTAPQGAERSGVQQAEPSAAPVPDRQPTAREWGYRPAAGEVAVNPPSLTWVHETGAAAYTVQIAADSSFADAITVKNHPWPTYTHDQSLPNGRHFWRYRIQAETGEVSRWSRSRSFTVTPEAQAFPLPSIREVRRRIPEGHPRLLVRPEDVAALRAHASGAGHQGLLEILAAADSLIRTGPTPEPAVRASLSEARDREHWWPNAVQTRRAVKEAELLAFAYLLTGDEGYGEAARRWILHIASWDPDGPTNWDLNDEAGMPILRYLPVAYTWAYDALSEADRRRVQQVMLRRATEAWHGWQTKEGVGHLNEPYSSHGNRSWFKLAGAAIAFIDVFPDAERWLDFALNNFHAAYPVWSDADGGWHEGTAYLAGYVSGVTWWLEIADRVLGIDGMKKPFFRHAGDMLMYTAPPGSPNLGFGDLSHGSARSGWSFVHYYARKTGNSYWPWWAGRSGVERRPAEPVAAFFWSMLPEVEARSPADLPPSKVFRGTGLAFLNHTLVDSRDNVQVRLKSSPFGRQSHGHDPHNSFTVNAYGEALLVNNVYRDFWASPFHREWVWSTRAQNALLVDGEGQTPNSREPFGEIVAADLQPGADYVAGEAGLAYQGRLRRFTRHVVFVKPDVIVFADEIEAVEPSTFQWMLHAEVPFEVDAAGQTVHVRKDAAGALIHLIAPRPLLLEQASGYDPEPDRAYMDARGGTPFPTQWRIEAATPDRQERIFVLSVVRPYRGREAPPAPVVRCETDSAIRLAFAAPDGTPIEIAVRKPGATTGRIGDLKFTAFAVARHGSRTWELGRSPASREPGVAQPDAFPLPSDRPGAATLHCDLEARAASTLAIPASTPGHR
jgi:hypothetical protein